MTVSSEKSIESRTCHLTERLGEQFYEDVNVTLHFARERSDRMEHRTCDIGKEIRHTVRWNNKSTRYLR